ncbi:MAG: type II toxin-antitoxin system RelE/ParE family toxin [Verrucomicrobia bacterium]|nr:type II toxin-antitoxin system RelE/ParE family toxin [Verrucomicrobiota bacterium]
MLALKKHPLLNADLQAAFDWYEGQRPGLGWEFKDDFKTHFRNLRRDAQLYAVRFGDVRRLNLDRFPYGLFYVIRPPEIWLLAVLHASRDTEMVLAERRRHLRG